MKIFKKISFIASAYVHASEATKNYYIDYLADRPSIVIPAPIDTDILSDDIQFHDLREKESIVIGIVCNINPIKNLEEILGDTTILINRYYLSLTKDQTIKKEL